MVNLDYTLWIQMVNFLLLIVILHFLLYKPILGIIEKRKSKFESNAQEVQSLQKTIDQKMAEYEEKLRQAKIAAMTRRQEQVGEGTAEAQKIIDAVRADIPALLETFQSQLDRQIAAAKQTLQEQSHDISKEIAEKVLGRPLQ